MIELRDIFFKILIEGSYESSGVGDKEFERILGYSSNEPDTKTKADLQLQTEKPISKILDTHIYKNPKTLENFDKYIRALGNIKGELYVAQKDGNFNHFDLAKKLGFNTNTDGTFYLRLIRVMYKDIFFVMTDCEDQEKCEKIIGNLKKSNPQYRFITRGGKLIQENVKK